MALKSCSAWIAARASYQSWDLFAPARSVSPCLSMGSREVPHARRVFAAACTAPIIVSIRSPVSPTKRNSSTSATVSSMAVDRFADQLEAFLVGYEFVLQPCPLREIGPERQGADAKLKDLPAIRQQRLVLRALRRVLLDYGYQAEALG